MSGQASPSQLARLLYIYGLTGLDALQLEAVRPGSQNLLVRAGGEDYDLVLLDDRTYEEANWQQLLLERLPPAGLPVKTPIRTLDGMPTALFRGSPAWLLPGHEGQAVRHPSLAQLRSVGRFLALLHQVAVDGCGRFPAPAEWAERADLDKPEAQLWRGRADALTRQLGRISLRESCIHGSPGCFSVLFDGDDVAEVRDFAHSGCGPAILDLAFAGLAWCLAGAVLDEALFAAVISGYEEVAELSPAEREALPMAVALAACLARLRTCHARARFPGLEFEEEGDWSGVYEKLSGGQNT